MPFLLDTGFSGEHVGRLKVGNNLFGRRIREDRMAFDDIEKFCAAYMQLEDDGGSYSWSTLDRAIIDVCAAMPRHCCVEEVYAKVRIVNRAYLANLHMAAKEAEWKVAERFVEDNADEVIAPLHSTTNFSVETLSGILDVHDNLVNLALQATGKILNVFISKYLHFHFPNVVPILDDKANNAARTLAQPLRLKIPESNECKSYDYGIYCGRLLQIMGDLHERGVAAPNLKLLDVLLYGSRIDGAGEADEEEVR